MQNASTMSHRRRNRTLGALCLAALSALSFVVASGSSKSEAAAAPGRDAPAQVAAASSYKTDNYAVEVKLDGACTAGKECKAIISLEAKKEFHINDKYPIKFKAADPAPEGVTFTKAIVKKDDGKFDTTKGTLPVGFTIAKAGEVTLAGIFSFSVCSDANCIMEKLDLKLVAKAN